MLRRRYLSLPITLVSANNAIYQSTCVFVYIFSVLFLKENVTWRKSAAITVSMAGVVVVALFAGDTGGKPDANAPTHTPTRMPTDAAGFAEPVCKPTSELKGYLACVASVCAFALFEVSFKKLWRYPVLKRHGGAIAHGAFAAQQQEAQGEHLRTDDGRDKDDGHHQHEGVVSTALCLGLIGVFSIAFLWVVPVAMLKFEPWRAPSSRDLAQIVGNGMLDTLFNFFFLAGVALTSPLFMSVGTQLIIPLGIFVDWWLGPSTFCRTLFSDRTCCSAQLRPGS